MTETSTTFPIVAQFIANQATTDDVDAIHNLLRSRAKALREIRAAQVRVGMAVKTADIKPKYLAHLTGTVSAISGTSATITLDKASTRELSLSSMKYHHLLDKESHDLSGVPLSCCTPV